MLVPVIISLLCSIICSHAVEVNVGQSVSIDTLKQNQPNTHEVYVGGYKTFGFEPNRLNANIGDLVIFKFHGLNHTLTESSLDNPCKPLQQFDSGFHQFNPSNRSGLMISFVVNSLEPRWFFCRQIDPTSHCHAGMVFALNPGDHMGEFLINAKGEQKVVTTVITRSTTSWITAATVGATTGPPPLPATCHCSPTWALSGSWHRSMAVSSGTGPWPTATASAFSMPRSIPSLPFTSGTEKVLLISFPLQILLGLAVTFYQLL
ncbi:uncharacterized protein CIMG_08734 [Coccidioides immitis RS]|uniref:Extracellular serine-rich protein n=1 Tax=Coccidioides immitis (strain RS) TaxID=246410 RepID=A0A0E1S1E9_COCIM|nr:uncharacterized protein CIMG_08734 [Coccidioides immitis RS]EAS29988.2 hypothetical protein CIMG_08734 [Coccidioides immitis RS]